jgi:hypothetical protein
MYFGLRDLAEQDYFVEFNSEFQKIPLEILFEYTNEFWGNYLHTTARSNLDLEGRIYDTMDQQAATVEEGINFDFDEIVSAVLYQ